MLVDRDLPKRLLYYWAKAYVEQLSESMTYAELSPAVVVCFLGQSMFRQSLPYHHSFRLWDCVSQLGFTDDLSLHTIELSKLPQDPAQLVTPLDRWAWFLEHASELDTEKLPDQLATSGPIRDAMNELTVIARTPEERAAYERELKRRRDEIYLREGPVRRTLIAEIARVETLIRKPRTSERDLYALPLASLQGKLDELWQQALPAGTGDLNQVAPGDIAES